MAINKLTDLTLRKIKPTDKEQLLSDGGGLFMRVRPIADGGATSFRYAYRVDKKLRWLTLKAITLAEARKERDGYKRQLKSGIDPTTEKTLEIARQRKGNWMNRPNLPSSKP
jgi:hypothetical protein